MAVIDALLEVSRHWDMIQETMTDEQLRRSPTMFRAGPDSRAEESALRVLEWISPGLHDDSPVFAALEFSPNRSVTMEEAPPPALWPHTGLAMSPIHRFHRFETEVDLVLQSLQYRTNVEHTSRRLAARRRTLSHLTSSAPAGGDAAMLPATSLDRPGRAGPRVEAEFFVWFDIVAAFSLLPPEHQNRTITLAAKSGASTLLPSFQFRPAGDSLSSPSAVDETNRLLLALEDPWGAGSWWSRPNGRLGAVPSQLIGTERETELPFAAATLQSDSW